MELVNALAVNWELAVVLSVIGLTLVSLILLGGAVVLKGGFTPPEQDSNETRI